MIALPLYTLHTHPPIPVSRSPSDISCTSSVPEKFHNQTGYCNGTVTLEHHLFDHARTTRQTLIRVLIIPEKSSSRNTWSVTRCYNVRENTLFTRCSPIPVRRAALSTRWTFHIHFVLIISSRTQLIHLTTVLKVLGAAGVVSFLKAIAGSTPKAFQPLRIRCTAFLLYLRCSVRTWFEVLAACGTWRKCTSSRWIVHKRELLVVRKLLTESHGPPSSWDEQLSSCLPHGLQNSCSLPSDVLLIC